MLRLFLNGVLGTTLNGDNFTIHVSPFMLLCTISHAHVFGEFA